MNIFLQHPIYSLNTEPVLLPLQITIPAQISYMTNSPLSQLNSALGTYIRCVTASISKTFPIIAENTADAMGAIDIQNPGNDYELIGYNITSSWAWGVMNCIKVSDTQYNVYVSFHKPYQKEFKITATVHSFWRRKNI